MQIKKIGEEGVIKIAQNFALPSPAGVLGIGDDAAVVEFRGKLLVTSDLLVENIHFKLSLTPPQILGKKALAVNLSDIAAMGGIPRYALISLALPAKTSVAFVEGFYQGFNELAREYGVLLIGGDTTGAEKDIVIAVTVLGEALNEGVLKRSGALPGNGVYVSGYLGDSAAGLNLLLSGKTGILPREVESYLIARHLEPIPRVKLGQILCRERLATSANDLSDGLTKKLWEIAKASGVEITINRDKLPISPALLTFCQKFTDFDPGDLALNGGEDYELLFTVPAAKEKELLKLNLPLYKIGIVSGTAALGMVKADGGGILQYQGFQHF